MITSVATPLFGMPPKKKVRSEKASGNSSLINQASTSASQPMKEDSDNESEVFRKKPNDLERNRAAASKSRAKKKAAIEELQAKGIELKQQNIAIKDELARLDVLKAQLLAALNFLPHPYINPQALLPLQSPVTNPTRLGSFDSDSSRHSSILDTKYGIPTAEFDQLSDEGQKKARNRIAAQKVRDKRRAETKILEKNATALEEKNAFLKEELAHLDALKSRLRAQLAPSHDTRFSPAVFTDEDHLLLRDLSSRQRLAEQEQKHITASAEHQRLREEIAAITIENAQLKHPFYESVQ
jgi:Basic region leucine zipper/bZIP transcription factor